jgi:hypothetical protein
MTQKMTATKNDDGDSDDDAEITGSSDDGGGTMTMTETSRCLSALRTASAERTRSDGVLLVRSSK